jgi:hypothetical protein
MILVSRDDIGQFLREREDIGTETLFSLLFQPAETTLYIHKVRFDPVLLVNASYSYVFSHDDYCAAIEVECGYVKPPAVDTDLYALTH